LPGAGSDPPGLPRNQSYGAPVGVLSPGLFTANTAKPGASALKSSFTIFIKVYDQVRLTENADDCP
jgi:hypothetical protein